MSLAEKALKKIVGVGVAGGKAGGKAAIKGVKALPGARAPLMSVARGVRGGGNALTHRAARLALGAGGAKLQQKSMENIAKGNRKSGAAGMLASMAAPSFEAPAGVSALANLGRKAKERSREMSGMDVVASLGAASRFEKQASIGETVATAMALTAATAGVGAGIKAIGRRFDRHKSEAVWQRLKKDDPTLSKDPVAREHFEVLQQFSPSIASNRTTARSFLDRTRRLGVMPHEMVDQLAGTEDRLSRGGTMNMALGALPSNMSTASNLVSSQRSHRFNVEQAKGRAKADNRQFKLQAARGGLEEKKLNLAISKSKHDMRMARRKDKRDQKALRLQTQRERREQARFLQGQQTQSQSLTSSQPLSLNIKQPKGRKRKKP